MERALLCSCWSRYFLCIWISLPWMQCFSQSYHSWTYRMFYPPSLYSTRYCFWSMNSLPSQSRVTVGQGSWNPLVLPCSLQSWRGWPDRKMEWQFEVTVTVTIKWQKVLKTETGGLQKAVYALDQHLICGFFSHSRDSQMQESRDGKRSKLHSLSWPSDPLGKKKLLIPETLSFVDLDVWGPSWRVFFLGATTHILLNWKLGLPSGHFGLLMPLSQQAKKWVTVLEKMIDPDDHGEIRLLLYKGVKKDYVWSVEDPLGNILVVGMMSCS